MIDPISLKRGHKHTERINTLIAMDGSTEIRTPHDSCLLVMPSLRPSRGHAAIRLARLTGRGNKTISCLA